MIEIFKIPPCANGNGGYIIPRSKQRAGVAELVDASG